MTKKAMTTAILNPMQLSKMTVKTVPTVIINLTQTMICPPKCTLKQKQMKLTMHRAFEKQLKEQTSP